MEATPSGPVWPTPRARRSSLRDLLERKVSRAKLKGRASIRTMEWNVRAITSIIPPETEARAVTEVEIERFVQAKLDAGFAPASVNRLLALLRSAFNIAYKTIDENGNRLVARVPEVEMLEEDNVRQTMPTQAEYLAIRRELAKVKRQVPGTLPRLFTFYRISGYRNTEPLRLRWDRVDQVAGLIQLPKYDSKSKKWRSAWPYKRHPELRRVIEEQWAAKEETQRLRSVVITHVFFRPNGKPIKCFRKAWVKARAAIGRPDLWVHDFRRAAYRDLIRSGTDPKTARQLIGAKTPSIGDRYHIVTEQDVSEAADKLARYHAETAGTDEQLVLPFRAR